MKAMNLETGESKVLVALAVFGFLVPNGAFVYYALTDYEAMKVAISNPISLVFIGEAFFLMCLFAWVLRRAGVRRPSGAVFIIMSLVGSMVFSVPATLYLMIRSGKATEGVKPYGSG
jgi:hypothetical protein